MDSVKGLIHISVAKNVIVVAIVVNGSDFTGLNTTSSGLFLKVQKSKPRPECRCTEHHLPQIIDPMEAHFSHCDDKKDPVSQNYELISDNNDLEA